jgi:perosamine synthetase
VTSIKLPDVLSGYLGSRTHGGHYCRLLEIGWASRFSVEHAIAVNSATSGLLAACMAIGVNRDCEVIVPAWTMSATAAAPAVLGADIRFADITDNFTIDPKDAASLITSKTKAIIATNLFGHPADLHMLKGVCDEAGIFLIEDNAQAILATEYNRYTGTIGHMGVFSLNVHKHIQIGEGGVVVTNGEGFAEELRGAMNHGEMRGGIPGLNLRMTEVSAMMASEQLDIVDQEVNKARKLAKEIKNLINERKSIWYYPDRGGCENSYYCLPVSFLPEYEQILREVGVRNYEKPLYKLPAFHRFARHCSQLEKIADTIFVIELCHNPRINEVIEAIKALP